MDRNTVLTDPRALLRVELAARGLSPENLQMPARVWLLADGLFDRMQKRTPGRERLPVAGGVYRLSEGTGYAKGALCAAAMATQAEDLWAAGAREIIHLGFAGGIADHQQPGQIVVTAGACHDTAVPGLYGQDDRFVPCDKELSRELARALGDGCLPGIHWTTDAGYRETWGQVLDYRARDALCVEMEGAGLFAVAAYRGIRAAAAYVLSDVLDENGWHLGWGGEALEAAQEHLLNAVSDRPANTPAD
ncbi:MAG: phosphorylase [Eubacteriales bacterium]|nr:phosphorylase [Eubacteriales bacterium]